MNEKIQREDNKPEKVKLMEKIQKLMDLADGTCYDDEESAARRKITQLIVKYELGDINFNNLRADLKFVEEEFRLGKKQIEMTDSSLLSRLAKYTGVYLLQTADYGNVVRNTRYGPRDKWTKTEAFYVMIGRPEDIAACQYLYKTIRPQVDVLANKWFIQKKQEDPKYKAKFRNDYKRGLVHGVDYNLDKINEDVLRYKKDHSLIVINPNEKIREEAQSWYKRDHKVRSIGGRYRRNSSYEDGFSDSENIKIQRGVNGPQDSVKRLS
jgi:HD superfamily phosphohydrolase